MKSVSVFLLLNIVLFHDFLFHDAGKPFFRMGGSSFAHTTQRSSLFLFWKGFDALQSGRVAKINNIFSAKRAKKCDFVAVIQYIMS